MTPQDHLIQQRNDAMAAVHGTIPIPRICYHGAISYR